MRRARRRADATWEAQELTSRIASRPSRSNDPKKPEVSTDCQIARTTSLRTRCLTRGQCETISRALAELHSYISQNVSVRYVALE